MGVPAPSVAPVEEPGDGLDAAPEEALAGGVVAPAMPRAPHAGAERGLDAPVDQPDERSDERPDERSDGPAVGPSRDEPEQPAVGPEVDPTPAGPAPEPPVVPPRAPDDLGPGPDAPSRPRVATPAGPATASGPATRPGPATDSGPTTRPGPATASGPAPGGAGPPPGLHRLGPGPALVVAAAGPALAARRLAVVDGGGDGIPLVGTGPALGATTTGALALLLPLAVGLAGVVLTRVRPASRLLLVAGGAAGLAAVRGLADPAGASAVGLLLGLPVPWSAVLAWGAGAVVLALTVALLGRELTGRTAPVLGPAWGVTAVAVLLPWPTGSALPFVVVAALVLGLLAGVAAAGEGVRGDGPGPRRATLRGRGDLSAPAGAAVLALLLAAASSRPQVAPRVGVAAAVLAVAALLLAGERLGRWRSAGPLEVLVRCVGGTLVVVAATGVVRASVVTDAQDGVTGWRVGLAALGLGSTLLAAALPRPRAPHYTRETHLRVLRSVPWVLVALAVVAGSSVVGARRPGAPAATTIASPDPAPAAVPGSVPPSGATGAPPSSGSVPPTATASRQATRQPSGPTPTPPASALPGTGPRPLAVSSSPSASPSAGPWMSVGAVSGSKVTIVIGSTVTTGDLEVRTVVGEGAEISYPLVAVSAGSSAQVTVLLPQTGDFSVELHDLRRSEPLQVLTLSR